MSPYREKYRRELNNIKISTKNLADLVSSSADYSVQALMNSNFDLAKRVIQGDQEVDDLSQEIETLCMELLALQQPMATDLRQIIGILKISIDLERVGDLAVDIARVSIQIKQGVEMARLEYIPRMADISRRMLSQSMEALTNYDADMARHATKWDYEIDGLYVKVRDKLLKIIIEKPEILNEAILLLMVNRHLERIGDHICNICESIVYMVEARREHLN
ncbi:MAG: phosphate signaling complex protein PhoU [Methanotrichaceae archaeon]|nr:phosphate signaling complex protein PhoU [Methanotrichaceae archaeon]